MRANTELIAIGAACVFLAFFSWPVPRLVKDIYQTGVGRLVVLGAIAYLAKFQSIPLAILLAIYYVKACRAAYQEGMENKEDEKEEKKEKSKEDEDPSRKASSGNASAHKGSDSGATGVTSSKTENFQNFMPF
jgi:hypothetical protein